MKTQSFFTTLSHFTLVFVLALPSAFAGGISSKVQEKANNNPNDMLDLIVSYHKAPDDTDRAHAEKKNGKVKRKFKAIKGHAVRASAHEVGDLINNPNVLGLFWTSQ